MAGYLLLTLLQLLLQLFLSVETSRLCVYKYSDDHYPNYCTESHQLCDVERNYSYHNAVNDVIDLYGYQTFTDIESCQSYQNKEVNSALWCLYKCTEDDYPNFCIGKATVCPLWSPDDQCPLFYVPQFFDNITECDNNKNNSFNTIQQQSPSNVIGAFQISKPLSTTHSNVIITFYNNYTAYQCNVNIISTQTYYYCETSSLFTTECDMNQMNLDIAQYGMQIDIDGKSEIEIEIESIFIMNVHSTDILIEYFCFDNDDNCLKALHGAADSIKLNQWTPSVLLRFDNTQNVAGYANVNQITSIPQCFEVSPITFGFSITSDAWNAEAISKHTVTLLWNGLVFQAMIYPTQKMRYYKFNTNDLTHGQRCSNTINTTSCGIIIENDGNDAAHIGNVIIQIVKRNITAKISYFCFLNESESNFGSKNFVENKCSDNGGYAALSIDSDSFKYGLINITPNNIATQEAYVAILETPTPCLPELPQKFILVQKTTTWIEAQKHCETAHHSDLATMTTDEDIYIAIKQQNHNFMKGWIGLNDIDTENYWTWKDSTSCHYAEDSLCINDKHWISGQPDNLNGEHCAVLHKSIGFNDLSCYDTAVEYFYCNNNNYTFINRTDINDSQSNDVVIIIYAVIIISIVCGLCMVIIICCAILVIRERSKKKSIYIGVPTQSDVSTPRFIIEVTGDPSKLQSIANNKTKNKQTISCDLTVSGTITISTDQYLETVDSTRFSNPSQTPQLSLID